MISGTPYYSSVAVNAGKLILSGTNEYLGLTSVNNGTLVVNSALAGPVSVTGGVLTGTGRTASSLTIGSSGTFLPGVGSFTVAGMLSMTTGSGYQPELSTAEGKAGKVIANGVTAGGASLTVSHVGTPSAVPVGTGFILVENTAGTPVSGTFDGFAEGSLLEVGAVRFRITYQGGDGNDIALIAAKRTQTIAFNPLPVSYTADPDVDPAATASSGLTVSYTSSNTNVAEIAGGKIRITGAGTTTITAGQAGDDTYEAAAPVSRILSVTERAGAPPMIISYPATVTLSGASTRFSVVAQGVSFVVTGPGGYVFSSVHRREGQYEVVAENITQPGAYQLQVTGENGSRQTIQVVVTAPAGKLILNPAASGGN